MNNLTNSVVNAQTSGSSTTGGNSTVAKPYIGEVLTKYGEPSRDDNGGIIKANHDGIDYKGSIGTTVTAVADGTVVEVRTDSMEYTAAEIHAKRYGKHSYGNLVKIQHEDKVVNGKSKTQHTVYSHLKDVFVKVKQKVKKGDPVGTLGRTGQAYSPHLHFEYLIDGKASNPSNFKQYTDKSLQTTQTSGSGMDASALTQANSTAQALMGLFSGNMDQMRLGLDSLAKSLGIDASKYGLAGSNDGFGTGNSNTNTSSGTTSSGNPITNNTTINVNIPNATPDEAKKFAELVAQYQQQDSLTSNMGRF